MASVYEILQELWAKAFEVEYAGNESLIDSQEYSSSKRAAIDEAATKINAVIWGNGEPLPEIPRGRGLALKKMPYFMSLVGHKEGYPNYKEWFVVGLAEDLPPGEAVEVNRHGDDGKQVVVLRQHEYERVVNRGKENERRYVLASFDREGFK